MLNIALINPKIPQNTGNIARLAAGINAKLILVGELGFSLDDKYLKRAGLDYWDYVDLEYLDSLDLFEQKYLPEDYYYALITKFGNKRYDNIFSEVKRCNKMPMFVFGNETEGLPSLFHKKFENQKFYIPMNSLHIRSLNLSNSAALVVYDYLRQDDFRDIDAKQSY
ncbi:tRNA (cytidine(34)-2'-O)-methyltransferase [Deferribacterales bacterium Es71-Z0220]|jgi:tRNA (cytidine/uridine-2'-O-)-methyltransferase|uniref:tRNA (cytidine(34)-2'-O)-methyltransferase n=1 Tax=Deferrivibrio essentukiensis TaxID=2880922 RepID=UPI001F61CB42|nr:tRNA (cytidine(34)-2'-O)-methyltransferase [Deferrivibrio essentukiensis]MCB4204097.1 tRNA (cytidine(34)-2'-O)-methyltransferase [Deferrivibrio essentukiensis]